MRSGRPHYWNLLGDEPPGCGNDRSPGMPASSLFLLLPATQSPNENLGLLQTGQRKPVHPRISHRSDDDPIVQNFSLYSAAVFGSLAVLIGTGPFIRGHLGRAEDSVLRIRSRSTQNQASRSRPRTCSSYGLKVRHSRYPREWLVIALKSHGD